MTILASQSSIERSTTALLLARITSGQPAASPSSANGGSAAQSGAQGSAGTGASGAGNGDQRGGGISISALSIEISRSSSVAVATADEASAPRRQFADKLSSLGEAVDRLRQDGPDAAGASADAGASEKLDRLHYVLDALNLILKNRNLGKGDKLALLGSLAKVAKGEQLSDDEKQTLGGALGAAVDARHWSDGRKAAFRDLNARYTGFGAPDQSAADPTSTDPTSTDAGAPAFTAARIDSLSISIKGAFTAVTDQGTFSAEFELSAETVRGLAVAVDGGGSAIQAIAAQRSSLSLQITAARSYGADSAAPSTAAAPAGAPALPASTAPAAKAVAHA